MDLPTPSLILLSLELQCENVRMMQVVSRGAVSGSANAIAPISVLRASEGECEDDADGEGRGCQWLCQRHRSYCFP